MTDWGFEKLAGSSAVLKALIDSDVGKEILTAVDEDGWGLLHVAAFTNNVLLAGQICDRGCEEDYTMVNKLSDAGETAFGVALRLEHTQVAERIARHRAFDLSKQQLGAPGPFGGVRNIDDHPSWPVWRLAAAKSIDEARELVKAVDLGTVKLEKSFGFQVINYHAVQAVLEKMVGGGSSYDLNVTARLWNILHHALHDGEDAVARLLLQHKPPMDLRTPQSAGGSALHIAAQKGREFAVEAILERMDDGALLDLENDAGKTPRQLAQEGAKTAIMKMIQDFDAVVALAKSPSVAECRKVVEHSFKDAQRCSVCIDRNRDSALPCGHVFCGGRVFGWWSGWDI